MLVCIIPFQNVFAVDVPLSKDDPAPASQPRITTSLNSYSLLSTSTITETVNAVTVDLTGNELILNFYNQVGIVQISIVDRSGFIVYQDAVDTYSTDQLIIPVDYLISGKYTINISYGTTSLTGTFRLY